MSRSIVRSKINAKYNAGGTGGGGISLIAFVTAAQLLTLKNASGLVPGRVYCVTDAPIIFLPGQPLGSFFYIRALYTDTLESVGTLAVLQSTGFNVFREIECWYDVDTNTHPKYSDAYNNNTIEGWSNIQTFFSKILSLFPNGIFDVATGNNTIINNSVFAVNSNIAGLGAFYNNYIDNSTFLLDSPAISDISFNNFTESFLNLTNINVTKLARNHIKHSSINTELGNINNAEEFASNYIESSIINFVERVDYLTKFSDNRIYYSQMTWTNNPFVYYIEKNFINHSIISFDNTYGNCQLANFDSNNIEYTGFYLYESAGLQLFKNNSLNSTLFQIFSSAGFSIGSDIVQNTIHKSFIELFDSLLNYCNIFGMGNSASLARFDTATNYTDCNYRLGEDSTFYAFYDANTIDVTNSFTMPPGHEVWVGKLLFTGSYGYIILQVINNPITKHRYSIYIGDPGITRLDVDHSGGFFRVPNSTVPAVRLTPLLDFAYIDGRPNPIGTSAAAEHVVINYQNY